MTNWDETSMARFRRAEAVVTEFLRGFRTADRRPGSGRPVSRSPVSRRARHAGVTLVEVLIVVAIMALLGGSVGFYALQQYKKAEKATAEEDARNLRKAI